MDDRNHGGAIDLMQRRFASAQRPWVDLSTGINPWPWPIPPELLTNSHLHQTLPTQDDWQRCRAAMAKAFQAEEETVLPVPGSASAIALLPHVIDTAKRVAILTPSYGDHARSWSSFDIKETPHPIDIKTRCDVSILCNPNNPDGRTFPRKEVLSARDTLAQRGGTLIVDEAYGELAPELSVASDCASGNLIVLRSFGKFYGLAGIRLGAVIASPHIIERISRLLGDWPISTLALHIGTHAYEDTAYASKTRATLKTACQALDKDLIAAGLKVVSGTDLFRLIEAKTAAALWTHLAHAGIYTRRFAWSDSHLRIGLPGTHNDSQRLTETLTKWQSL